MTLTLPVIDVRLVDNAQTHTDEENAIPRTKGDTDSDAFEAGMGIYHSPEEIEALAGTTSFEETSLGAEENLKPKLETTS